MPICTRCGAIFNDDDFRDGLYHECKPEDIPSKGMQKRVTATGVVIEKLNEVSQ